MLDSKNAECTCFVSRSMIRLGTDRVAGVDWLALNKLKLKIKIIRILRSTSVKNMIIDDEIRYGQDGRG